MHTRRQGPGPARTALVLVPAKLNYFYDLHGRSAALGPDGPDRRPAYWFVPNGLTESERKAVGAAAEDDHRPLPWAFVGHTTPNRAALVDRVMQQVDPRGFVYMPGIGKITEKGSPHLHQRQVDAVLRRTRYQVRCST